MFTGRFARHQRLTRPSEFKQVFARACKTGNQHLTLLCRQNDQDVARLGLAIAKRYISTAVARNRVKRIVRTSFRQHQAELSGLDIVVLGKTSAGQLSKQELFSVLEKLWQGLIKKCKDSSSP
ncbi:MAG: ribonuclease P protein component [Gammaproteobacteria bacterium]|nr:ribonuclease P protein component [Gammaproteobacteria bacterium]MDH5778783.1 ribonuclease P protein component [Gammaproteobacteria bacterium]